MRWSAALQTWFNATYDLPRLTTQGTCCGGAGPLATDGTHVWISTEQGTYLFRGDSWQPLTYHWGHASPLVAGGYLFESGARWSSAFSPVSATYFRHGSCSVTDPVPSAEGLAIFSPLVQKSSGLPDVLTDVGVFVFAPAGSQPPVDAAPPPTRSNNFDFDTATFLGSDGNDTAIGIAVSIDSDGREVLVSAANLAGAQLFLGSDPYSLATISTATASSRGYLLFRSADASASLRRVVQVADSIDHFAVSRSAARIAIAANGKVIVVDGMGEQVLWTFGVSGKSFFRVSIDETGRVAALCETVDDELRKILFLFDAATGSVIATREIPVTDLYDVAITSKFGGIVWVAGQELLDIFIRKPYLRAFVPVAGLPLKYGLFPFSASQITSTSNTASSRIVQLHFGADDNLYLLGDSHGGNSLLRYSGYDLVNSTLVSVDDYSTAWNLYVFSPPPSLTPTPLTFSHHPSWPCLFSNGAKVLYYARVNASTGTILKAQFRLGRQVTRYLGAQMPADGAALVANSKGELLISGIQQCCSPGQRFHRVNCQRAQTASGDLANYVIGLSSDFRSVLFWNTISQAGIGRNAGVAMGQNGSFVLLESRQSALPIQNSPVQQRMGSFQDSDLWIGYFSSAPKADSATCSAESNMDEVMLTPPDSPVKFMLSTFAPMPPASPAPITTPMAAAPVISQPEPAADDGASSTTSVQLISTGAAVGIAVAATVVVAAAGFLVLVLACKPFVSPSA